MEDLLLVGTKIRIGKKYAQEVGGLEEGEIITLIEGYFEHENGLYVETHSCPAIPSGDDDFDSIYHLFGNKFEYWYDCEIIK